MTILTQADSIKSHYNDKVISRPIDNHIARIHLDKRLPKQYPTELLARLNTLANLHNEDFKALSDFQERTRVSNIPKDN